MNDIDINRINHAFITDFEFYLKSVKKIGNNTSVKYIKNFGKIIRICMANGWLDKNPLINYKAKLKEVNRDFLTMDEVNLIGSKSFLSTRIELVRDIFVFSCFTGLAYVDVKRLTRNHINIGIDGGKWIFIEREKTKVRSAIPLLPRAQEILTKYENHPVVLNTNVALPILSNQKMNSYLKEIADVCGINKELTFHIARHTFATSVTLANGVPIESVSKMLGHSSIKMTQHYAKVLDKKIGEDMAVLRSRLNTKEQVQKTAVTA
jgi:site-specific recombinase XerD